MSGGLRRVIGGPYNDKFFVNISPFQVLTVSVSTPPVRLTGERAQGVIGEYWWDGKAQAFVWKEFQSIVLSTEILPILWECKLVIDPPARRNYKITATLPADKSPTRYAIMSAKLIPEFEFESLENKEDILRIYFKNMLSKIVRYIEEALHQ